MQFARHAHGGVDDTAAQAGRQAGTGRDFNDLLATALQGAFAFPQMGYLTGTVANDLHLDMAGIAQQPLGI